MTEAAPSPHSFRRSIAEAKADTLEAFAYLERTAASYGWLHDAVHETRSGGGGSTSSVCWQCQGDPAWRDDMGRACEDCTPGLVGDVGELVAARQLAFGKLTRASKQAAAARVLAQRMLDEAMGAAKAMGGVETVIDRGADRTLTQTSGSGAAGLPPTAYVDYADVVELQKAKHRRVVRGDELPPQGATAADSELALRQLKAMHDAAAIRAAAEAEGDGARLRRKRGNHWRGSR